MGFRSGHGSFTALEQKILAKAMTFLKGHAISDDILERL